MNHFISLFTLVVIMRTSSALDNGLALLPPMGYTTWNDGECQKSQ